MNNKTTGESTTNLDLISYGILLLMVLGTTSSLVENFVTGAIPYTNPNVGILRISLAAILGIIMLAVTIITIKSTFSRFPSAKRKADSSDRVFFLLFLGLSIFWFLGSSLILFASSIGGPSIGTPTGNMAGMLGILIPFVGLRWAAKRRNFLFYCCLCAIATIVFTVVTL